jgi:hypothetical protein
LPQLLVRGIIRRNLDAKIERLKLAGITVTYDNFVFNPYIRQFKIYDVHFSISEKNDSSKYGTIQTLEITGLRIRKLLKEKKFIARDLSLYHPVFYTRSQHNIEKEVRSPPVEQFLREVYFRSVTLHDAQWVRMDSSFHVFMQMHTDRIQSHNVLITNLNTDKIHLDFTSIVLARYTMNLPDDACKLTLNRAIYFNRNQLLTCDSINLIPTLDKRAFAAFFGQQKDRIAAQWKNIRIDDFSIDVSKPLKLLGRKLSFSFTLQSYRDKSYPFSKTSRSPLPAELLDSMNVKFSFDTLLITDSYAEYEELSFDSRPPGQIYFNIDTVFTRNVNNLRYRKTISLDIIGKFMNSGSMKLKCTIPTMTNGSYALSGKIEKIPLTKFNAILNSAALLGFERGTLDSLTFAMSYTDSVSGGWMKMSIDTLDINVFKAKNIHRKALLKTFILDKIIAKKVPDSRFISGTLHFDRDPRRSIFHYWWRTLFSGIRETMGLDKFRAAKEELKDKRREK